MSNNVSTFWNESHRDNIHRVTIFAKHRIAASIPNNASQANLSFRCTPCDRHVFAIVFTDPVYFTLPSKKNHDVVPSDSFHLSGHESIIFKIASCTKWNWCAQQKKTESFNGKRRWLTEIVAGMVSCLFTSFAFAKVWGSNGISHSPAKGLGRA